MHKPTFWNVARDREGPICFWCGGAICHRTASFDHVVPRALNGSSNRHNVVLSCLDCNNMRSRITSIYVQITRYRKRKLRRSHEYEWLSPHLLVFRQRIETMLIGQQLAVCLKELETVQEFIDG